MPGLRHRPCPSGSGDITWTGVCRAGRPSLPLVPAPLTSMSKCPGEGQRDGLRFLRPKSWGHKRPRATGPQAVEQGSSSPPGCSVCPCQGPISRGYSYTLQKNSGESWELTDGAGNRLSAPAVCFMIPPTDPEALALVDRYEGRGGSQHALTGPGLHSPGLLTRDEGGLSSHLHPLGG